MQAGGGALLRSHRHQRQHGNLLRCGATLAQVSERVGESCRQVLRRYGQL